MIIHGGDESFSLTLPYFEGPLNEAVKIDLSIYSEKIKSGQFQFGMFARNYQSCIEASNWQSVLPLASRIVPDQAVFVELAVAMAFEHCQGIRVPERANRIRMILCEMSRMSAHLLCFVRLASMAGSNTIVQYILKDREMLLDLIELLTGSRMGSGFMRMGGVLNDITEGFIEKTLETLEQIRNQLKEYNDLFTFNETFLKRTEKTGFISHEIVRAHGLTGPNARASGSSFDLRRSRPYLHYADVDFAVPVLNSENTMGGSTHDRLVIRLQEILQSIEIVKQAVEVLPGGPFREKASKDKNNKMQMGEGIARIEGPRGEIFCHLVSDRSDNPCHLSLSFSGQSLRQALPDLVKDLMLEDLALFLVGLDLSVLEIDR